MRPALAKALANLYLSEWTNKGYAFFNLYAISCPLYSETATIKSPKSDNFGSIGLT